MSTLGAGGNGFDLRGRGPSDAIAYPNLYQIFGSNATAIVNRIRSSIPSWAASQAGSGLNAAALQQIFQVQADLIINNNAPVMELFSDTGYPEYFLSLFSAELMTTDIVYRTLGILAWNL